MFLDAIYAKCADCNAVQWTALGTWRFFLLLTGPLVARKSPRGMEYCTCRDGKRRPQVISRDNAGKGRDTAISVRGIRLVVPGSHAEMKFCCTDEGNEGTYDAGRVEFGVRAACGSSWNIGMEQIGSVRYADVRLGNTRLSATVRFWCSGEYSGNLAPIPGLHEWDAFFGPQ